MSELFWGGGFKRFEVDGKIIKGENGSINMVEF